MTTAISTPSSVDRIEDLPGYDRSLGFFVEPGERLLGERCPDCGCRMLEMPMHGLYRAEACPWCMNHRGASEGEPESMFGSGFPFWSDPDHGYDGVLSEGRGLWMCGPSATKAACSVARAWREASVGTAVYVTEFDLFSMRDVPSLFHKGLVVVDALGTSDPGAWGLSKITAVLYERANRSLPTVLCSLFTPDKVIGKYERTDELTASAFKECIRGFKGVQA